MADAEKRAVAVPVATVWDSPGAVREIDRPAVAETPDTQAWADTMTREQKLDLMGRVHTQLLLGEPVVVLEESADHPEWVRIAAPRQPSDKDDRGYPGWVLRAHLGAPPAVSTHEAVIAVETAALEVSPDTQRVVTDVTYGTVLPVLDDVGPEWALRVGLPDGHSAWLDRSACVVRPAFGDGPGKLVADGAALVSAARRFVGLEYLWAGMSAYGLDCSGLVHLTFRALGLVVPRDAHDQATAGKRLPRSEARAGDLLFFARPGKGIHHVGFALDDPARVLHAPGTGSTVVDEPMNDDRRGTLLDYVVRFAS